MDSGQGTWRKDDTSLGGDGGRTEEQVFTPSVNCFVSEQSEVNPLFQEYASEMRTRTPIIMV